jgi:general stress protein 26
LTINTPLEAEQPIPTAEAMIAAAREIMSSQTYCAIVTVDESGRPRARTMNPFSPEDDLTVWFATISRSRKVREIRANPQVCLYYADHKEATGSVMIAGRAELVDEMSEKKKRERPYWKDSFPDWKYLLLIKVVPERIEVLNYGRGLTNEGDNWVVPSIELGSGERK